MNRHKTLRPRFATAAPGRRSASAATTMLGAGVSAIALLAAAPAQAADECGPAVAGAVTCTAAGNPYPAGVTYTPAGSIAVTTAAGAEIAGPVRIDTRVDGVAAGDIRFDHAGSATTATDVVDTVSLGGRNVDVIVSGTIDNAVGGAAPVYDADYNLVSEAVVVSGLIVDAAGDASFVNNGAISVGGGGYADGVVVNAAGDVTLGGTGSIAVSGGTRTRGLVVTSTGGGVSGTIANVSANGGAAVAIAANGTVTLDIDAIASPIAALDLRNGVFEDGQAPIRTGDVTLRTGTINGAVNVDNAIGAVRAEVNGVQSGGGFLLVSRQSSVSAAVNADTGGISITGGTTASLALASGITVNGGIDVTGIMGADLSIAQDVRITGDVALTTDGGEARVTVPTGGAIDGSVSATAQNGGTSAAIAIGAGATVGGGLTATGVTTASILIGEGATVAAGGGTIGLEGAGGSTFTNRGSFGSIETGGTIGGSAGNAAITNLGTMATRFALAGGGNSLLNEGVIFLAGGRGGALGDTGENAITNRGTIRVGNDRVAGIVTDLTGVATFANAGTIDLRNGVGGDTLRVTGVEGAAARFAGSGGSTLYLDLASGVRGALVDKLVVDGAITGSTTVVLNTLGTRPAFVAPVTIVQGGAGTSAGAITLVAPTRSVAVRYSTRFDAATNSVQLVGTPGDGLVRLARVNEGAQQLWHRSADTVAAHFSELRDARYGGFGAGGGRLWGTMYGQASRRRGTLAAGAFGVAGEADAGYRQNGFGAQLGLDVARADEAKGFTVGVTAGYQSSTLDFARTVDRTRFDVATAGLLVGFQTGGLFANALGQFSYYWARTRSEVGAAPKYDGNSYGGQMEVGYRLGGGRLFVEPVATIAYVRTNLDDVNVGDFRLDFGTFQGLRGKAGARIGSTFALGGGATVVAYAQGNYVHEFKGDGATILNDGVFAVGVRNRALPDFGEGRIGFSAGTAGGVTGFVEGFGTAGRSYRGGGGRAGLRLKL